jgi:hypothetical protein
MTTKMFALAFTELTAVYWTDGRFTELTAVYWTDVGFPGRKWYRWWNEVLKCAWHEVVTEGLVKRGVICYCFGLIGSLYDAMWTSRASFGYPYKQGLSMFWGRDRETQEFCALLLWLWRFPCYCRYFPWWLMASEWEWSSSGRDHVQHNF